MSSKRIVGSGAESAELYLKQAEKHDIFFRDIRLSDRSRSACTLDPTLIGKKEEIQQSRSNLKEFDDYDTLATYLLKQSITYNSNL